MAAVVGRNRYVWVAECLEAYRAGKLLGGGDESLSLRCESHVESGGERLRVSSDGRLSENRNEGQNTTTATTPFHWSIVLLYRTGETLL